jgi:STE24 endopeptidase
LRIAARLRRAAPLAVLTLAPLLAMGAAAAPAYAQTDSSASAYLEQRVTALPEPFLVTRDPRALVDPRRQQVAAERGLLRRILFLLGLFLPALALLSLWQSGRSAQLRDAIARRVPNRLAARFLFGAVTATVAALAVVPASLWSYRLAVAYQMTPEPLTLWLRDALCYWALAVLSVGFLTAFIYTLVERTRLWYLYTAAGLFVFVAGGIIAAPFTVTPALGAIHPLAGGPLRNVQALAALAHTQNVAVYVNDAPRRAIATGRIEGVGPTERIVLNHTLLAVATPGELAFVVSREFAHHVFGDVVRLAIAWTLSFILCLAVAVAIADRIRFRRDDDSLSRLPLVGALFAVVALAVLPGYNAYARGIEANADSFALGLTHNRAAAVRVLVRVSDESLTPLCPTRFSRLYLLTHPSLGSQIALVLGRPDPCP